MNGLNYRLLHCVSTVRVLLYRYTKDLRVSCNYGNIVRIYTGNLD